MVGDNTPDAFDFTDQTDVTVSTQVESDIVQVTGMDNGTAISIDGGGSYEYRICADGTCSGAPAYTSTAGTIDSGEYVQLRLTSSASYSTATVATLTVGTANVDWSVTTEAAPTTTIGDGTDPGNTTIAPGASATELDSFTLQTNTGPDTVSQATVTLAAGTSAGISLVEITSDDGFTVYGSATDPASDTVSIGSMSIPVSTTLTQFKVRITPKSHTNMPAPAGSTYSVTGTITSFTSTNAQAGTDTDSATVTIDNLSPSNVTGAGATPGDTQVTVSWSNPGDADFSNLVVLRNTATISDVPSEGSSPALDSAIGTSVVRYISNGSSFIDTGLTNGQIYFYRIFAKDTNGNFSATGVEVSATPAVSNTTTYQTGDGKGSASEVDDSLLDAANSTTNYGTDTTINVDGSPVQHAVIKFPNIFGPGANQIPRGSVITSATLEVYIPSDTGSDATVYQLIEAWDESQVTWDDRLTGQPWTDAGAGGTGSHKTTAEGTLPTGSTGWQSVDVKTSVQNWSNCEINEGWVFIPAGTSGWTFASSENATQANRPRLTVTYGAVATITTIGDGTDPGPVTIAPGAGATVVDAFTLQIDCGEPDTVTQATVTLAAGTAGGISLVEITSDDGLTVYGSASDPASETVSIGSMSIPVSTTLTQFKVRITPKSHANMPAPAGSTYSVTATITSFTSSYTQAGTDTDSATVTIDNLSPSNVTGAGATPGDTQVTVSWTNPGDADFSNLVVLRNTTTISDVPSEGSSPALDSTIGTSVVRYISSGTSFIDTGLTNDQIYFYRIFAKDTNGNYSATGVEVSATPVGASATHLYRSVGTTATALASGTGGGGGFPAVQATNTTTIDANQTDHSVNLPTGIQAGDLLIVGFTTFYDVSHTFPGGWTLLFSDIVTTNNTRASIYYRQADGTEGTTITVTTGGNALSSSVAYRITGHADPATQPPELTSFNHGAASTNSPDPPSLTPTGGAKDYLWLAIVGDRIAQITAYPTNYSNGITARSTAGPLNSSNMGGAERQLNAASENPGTFTMGSSRFAWAFTIGVHPIPSAASNELTISGSTATFSTALADNIGVGDVIQYDSDDNGSIDALAFIHGRTDSQTYTVKDKDGNAPTAVTSDYDWEIFRAYTSLANWASQTENSNITYPTPNDVNPDKDLVFAGTILNVACYADGADTTSVSINGWSTGDNNYIKIYTPVSSSEVGTSQRHSGKWDDSKYRIEAPSSHGIYSYSGAGHVRIDGIQIWLQTITGNGNGCIGAYQATTGAADYRISNNICRGASNDTYDYYGINIYDTGGASSVARIWNNIVYDLQGTRVSPPNGAGIYLGDGDFTGYVYNNTVYNCRIGFYRGAGTFVAKNNIAYSNTDNYYGTFDAAGTNNLSGPGTDSEIPPTAAQNGVTVTFVDPTGSPPNFHLDSSDTGAKDEGTPLSGDADLAFTDDIDGETRTGNWDIGADEYVAVVVPTTTIGDGTDPGNATVAPGAAATELDSFTLQTNTGADTVTQVTVTLAAGTYAGISWVEITSDDGSTVYGSASNPASDTVSIGSMSIPVSTTLTQFKVRITPKSHANMPAPVGSTYSVTGTITSFTSTNGQAGTDTDSATVTIDNLSPSNVTGASATPGDTQVTVSWTNPGDADFSNLVVLRNTATISDVPSEGSSPAIDSTIGTSVVRYISSGTSFIDTSLTNGQIYFYRVFAKDTNGNYSATGVEVSATPAETAAVPWYNTDWHYRKHLRIDSSRVAGDLNYFPVLISTTDENWIYSASSHDVYHVAQIDGGDILFTASNGTTKLDHEIEKYDPTTGELVAWVEVPTLSGSTDTGLYIYYGNTVLDPADNQWNANGTWDEGGSGNYKGVWHLKETPGVDAYAYDSTSNNNDGTSQGSMTSDDQVPGKIDGSLDFDGGDDYIDLPDDKGLQNITNAITISGWIKIGNMSQDQYYYSAGLWSGNNQGVFVATYNGGYIGFGTGNGTAFDSLVSSGTCSTDWQHVVATWNGTTKKIYINGSEDPTTAGFTGPIDYTGSDTLIGMGWTPSGGNFEGTIDELRISNVARTADEIKTSYNNQKAPAAFYTVGIEETPGAGADPFNNNWSYRKRITIDSAQVSCDLTNFPVLIKTTDPDLTQAQVDFDDILFTASDGTTKLDHEIEKYNSSTGEIVVWLEVPSVSSTTDTDIYLYYGNTNSVDQRNPTGAGVWEPNYVGVWHLSESPSDGVAGHLDSTSNNNVGTPQNFEDGGGGTTNAAGKIAGADSFAGDDDEVLLPNAIIGDRAAWTITAWMKMGADTADQRTIYSEGNTAATEYLFLYVDDSENSVRYYSDNNPDYPYLTGFTNVEDNQFHHVAMVQRSKTDRELFVDTVSQGTDTTNAGTLTNNTASIGYLRTNWVADPFLGIIDEVRISKIDRDTCWIEAEHNNQSNPEGFYTIGIEEQPGTDGDPLQNGWTYRKRLTIDASRVAGDLTNFPVLISTTDADWIEDSQTTPGHVAQTDGGDILFTASDGITKLDHEIEKYNPASGELVAWVEVRSLSGSTNTDIYIYYGNDTSLDEDENQWNAAGVWDRNFREVFHLHETSGTLYDSTRSGYTGAIVGSATQDADGKISKAVAFPGSLNSHVTLSDGSMASDQTFTFSAWVWANTLNSEWEGIVTKGRDSDDDWQGLWINGSNRLCLGWEADGGPGNLNGSVLSAGKWYYVAGTYDDDTNRKLYLNGTLDGVPDTAVSHDTNIDEGTIIGEDYPNGSALDGIVDEVRISKVARSAEWIQTEYNSQRAPAAFYTVGIEEQYGTGAEPFNNGWQYSKKITILASEVAADLTNFPVLINTTHADWIEDSEPTPGNVAQPDGGDILFVAGDRTTKLDHEIEKYDPATGELVAWVEVRSLSSTQDTDIFIFYGNANAVDQWNPTGAGVWEPNYVGVWHLKEATGTTRVDSTWNNNDLTDFNNVVLDSSNGKFAGAGDFDRTLSQSLEIADASQTGLDITGPLTVQAWINLGETDNGPYGIVYKWRGSCGTGDSPYYLRASDGDTGYGREGFLVTPTCDGSGTGISGSTTSMEAGFWYSLVGVYDGSNIRIYKNGGESNFTAYSSGIFDSDGNLQVGVRGTGQFFDGLIDEVRISEVGRSPAWIETEHNNQKTDSTFYVIDDDWVGPCWNADYDYRKKIAITASSVDIPSGYSVSVTLDHAALVSGGKSLASGDDLRVVHWDGSSWTELDRVLEPLSSWNNASTQIWFALVDPIAASSSDSTYYLHYGNPSASNPPDDWANVFMIGDDFNDGTLTTGVTTSTAGDASISETGGEAFIDLGTTEGNDAGIIVTGSALPSNNRFAIRHKTKVISGGGASGPEVKAIGIGESAGLYAVDIDTNENPRRRIISFVRADTFASQIYYFNAPASANYWDGTAWQTGNGWWTGGNLSADTYYIQELISNGTEWYVRISEADGTVLTTTTPILWTNTYDTGNDFWFYWGEVYTNYYYADVKSDWFYVRTYIEPEPTSALGGEEEGCRGEPTAVSLLSFTARGQSSSVLVEWETAQEIKNKGFNLYRAESPFGPFTKLNDKLIPGLTYSVKGKSYSFVDSNVTRGELYYYRLEDIDVYGKKTSHGPICVDWDGDGLPDDWEIAYGFSPLVNEAHADLDGDGLSNLEEYEHETDPLNPDSDGDGIPDGQESGKVDRGEPVETLTLTPGVKIVGSDDTGVTLELRTDIYEMEVVQVDEDVFQRLRISDYIHGFTQEVGKPELPMKGVLLDLPDGVSATLKVEATEGQTLSGYWIYPVPEKAVSGEEGSEHVAEFFTIDETGYSSGVFYPSVVADLGETYMFRDQQKLQIRFYPFAFNPEKKDLQHYTRIRVRVEYGFASTTTRSASRALALPVPTSSSSSSSPRALGWTPPSPNPIYKILVSEEGIYRLTGTWLAANGVNVNSMALDQVRVYNLGQEVPIHVYDGGVAGQFDSGDYIEFYSEPLATQYRKYADHNVYWLTDSGVSGGLRMGTIDGSLSGTQVPPSAHTSTVRYEEDKQYDGTVPGADSLDRWFFDRFVTGADWDADHPYYGGVGTDFDLHLPEVAGQGSLSITLFAPFEMDHEVEVSVNSTVRTLTWSGIGYYEATIDNVNLVEGLNTVTLRCNISSDGIMVDRFEVTYPRRFVADGDQLKFSHEARSRYEISGFTSNNLLAFDITQARDVRRGVAPDDFLITGPDPVEGTYTLDMEPQYGTGERIYLVLSTNELKLPIEITQVVDPDLSNGSNGADYILITHRDLGWDGNADAYPWLSDLVALRQGQGLRVKVVDVEDIYNEFSYGIVTPQAIKDFLTHAYNNWAQPAPQYVLLVGDSTYDYKDNLSLGTINYVPTYLSWTDYMGETLTDDWFARVSGGDAIPDLYIGRLPAATLAQADAMVNKILTYENTTNTKTWEKNVLLVADDQTAEYEGLFEIMSKDVAALIPAGMNSAFTEYLADYADPADLTATIKNKINNDGTLIVNYSGHGSVQIWTLDPIFAVGDVADLSNSNKLPFFVSMTCLTGFFGYPEAWNFPSLAEVLVRSANKGAVAAFMSTGMTQPEAQRILDASLFEAIFKQDIRALGPAISAAKQTLLANGAEFEDVSKTFLLFGDPATKLKIPLPTVPAGLVAEVQGSSILLTWQGAADANGGAVSGYNVYRSTTPGGPYTKVNTSLITGTGFTDTSAQTGTVYYVVRSVDSDGDESAPTMEVSVVAGARTVSTTSAAGGGGGGGGGCFISTIWK